MVGVLFTILSSVFLALTVIFDKLMINGDCYQSNARVAWFVSSSLCSILGLIITFSIWCISTDPAVYTETFSILIQNHTGTVLKILLAGLITSLTLRSYFHCFANGSTSTLVAMAIAGTPLLVYIVTAHFSYEILTLKHGISLILTVTGLLAFEYVSGEDDRLPLDKYLSLIGVVIFGTIYLVLLDQTLPDLEIITNLDPISNTLVVLPLYWSGFLISLISFKYEEMVNFWGTICENKHYFCIILMLEFIGMFFYFTEFIGIAKLDATLVALIIGAHIIPVWLFDMLIRAKIQTTSQDNFTVLFFKLKKSDFLEYLVSTKVVIQQAICIMIVISGTILWTN